MAKLNNPFNFNNIGKEKQKGPQRPYLGVEELSKLPRWNEVIVNFVAEPKTRTGSYYTLVTYFATHDKWQTKIGYFTDGDMYPIAQLFDMEKVDDTDQLLGKKFYVSFGVKDGNDGKQYVEITDYTLDPRQTLTDVTQDTMDTTPF